jgi:hypothetical protein
MDTGSLSLPYLIASRDAQSAASARSAEARMSPPVPQPPQRGQRHVLLHRHVHDQPLLAPVLGHEPHPGGHRPGGRAAPEPLPAQRDRARVVPVDAEDRPRHLAAPGPDQPGQGDDLAGPDGEGDVGEHALAGEPVHGEQRLARCDLLARRPFGQLPADHGPDQVARDQALELPAEHLPAVAHHGDPLAQREDLFQPVRDEQDGGARGAQRPHHVEEPVHLGRRERGRRLVHHDDPRLQRDGLADLDDLLVRDGQPRAIRAGSSGTPSRANIVAASVRIARRSMRRPDQAAGGR